MPTCLIAAYHIPQPNLDSASRRLFHFVEFLRQAGWRVVVAYENEDGLGDVAPLLRNAGVAMYSLRAHDITEVARLHQFDLALIAFWHVAEKLLPAIRVSSPHTRILVDSTDLHFVRHARHQFVARDGGGRLSDEYGRDMVRELNAYAMADGVLTVATKEADLLDDLLGSGLAMVVPDCESFPASDLDLELRSGVLFLGNFEHQPNGDAVRWFIHEVMPNLQETTLQAHPLRVVGNGLGGSLRQLIEATPYAVAVGWVPSVAPYIHKSRITVLPLRFGAGTKRKLIQTLLGGTPAVSTSVGVESFDLVHGQDVLVADEAVAFASAVERLANDDTLWQRIRKAGLRALADRHGPDAAERALQVAVDTVMNRAPKELVHDAALTPSTKSRSWPANRYRRMVTGFKRLVQMHTTPSSHIAIVSRGHEDLVKIDGRRCSHFPGDDEGDWLGFHPSSGAHALSMLTSAKQNRGVTHLGVPASDAWWLEHYEEVRKYVDEAGHVLHFDYDIGLIVDLTSHDRRAVGQTAVSAKAVLPSREPRISVVLPTRDRAELLAGSLRSLSNQSLDLRDFEVVVIDDGSEDDTGRVLSSLAKSLPIVHERIPPSGISAAKNVGLEVAQAPLVVFFDDDDVASRDLLETHLRAHATHPAVNDAVLGHTEWAPWLRQTEVMRFVTGAGGYLFSYDRLTDGQVLDYKYFWGGRSSCKRELLEGQFFDTEFKFGSEDIELGFRLDERGLQVHYARRALQYMCRPVDFDAFCQRCARQGRSLARCVDTHGLWTLSDWAGLEDIGRRWEEAQPRMAEEVQQVHALEAALAEGHEVVDELRKQLWDGYWWCFNAFKMRGYVEAGGRLE